MVAGFVMLGWVLARRTIKMRKRVNQDAKAANKAIQQIREHKEPAVPLCDAPAETQRWQAAMFDLQRELKAELDTRIVVVQTLLRQVDQRIEHLSALESSPAFQMPTAIAGAQHQKVVELLRSGHTAKEISAQTGLPLGDVEMTIATTGAQLDFAASHPRHSAARKKDPQITRAPPGVTEASAASQASIGSSITLGFFRQRFRDQRFEFRRRSEAWVAKKPSQDEFIGDFSQQVQHRLGRFVDACAEHDRDAAIGESAAKTVAERGNRVVIVGGVDDSQHVLWQHDAFDPTRHIEAVRVLR